MAYCLATLYLKRLYSVMRACHVFGEKHSLRENYFITSKNNCCNIFFLSFSFSPCVCTWLSYCSHQRKHSLESEITIVLFGHLVGDRIQYRAQRIHADTGEKTPHYVPKTTQEPINQSINPSIHQSIDPSINWSINQSISRSNEPKPGEDNTLQCDCFGAIFGSHRSPARDRLGRIHSTNHCTLCGVSQRRQTAAHPRNDQPFLRGEIAPEFHRAIPVKV